MARGGTASASAGPSETPAPSAEVALATLAGSRGPLGPLDVDVDALAPVYASAIMVDMPCQTAAVRALVARAARHAALAVRFDRRAVEMGVDTDDGIRMLRESDREDRSAERLLSSAYELGVKLAMRRPGQVLDVVGVDAEAEAATRARRAGAP